MVTDQKRTGLFLLRRPGLTAEARARLRDQHQRFGGIHWGAAFFGWLSANGLAVLVLAVVSAAGLAIGLPPTAGNLEVNRQRAENGVLGSSEQIGVAGGIAALVILAAAYFAGGY